MEKHIDIKKPCSENWETMKIGLHSRFTTVVKRT